MAWTARRSPHRVRPVELRAEHADGHSDAAAALQPERPFEMKTHSLYLESELKPNKMEKKISQFQFYGHKQFSYFLLVD